MKKITCVVLVCLMILSGIGGIVKMAGGSGGAEDVEAASDRVVSISSSDEILPSTGNSLSFDGINDYIQIPHSSTLDLGGLSGEYTVEFNIKTEITPSSTRWVIAKYPNGQWIQPYPIHITLNPNGKLSTAIFDGPSGNGQWVTSTSIITDNNWHLIKSKVDRNQNQISIIVDGVIENVTDISIVGDARNPAPVVIGWDEGLTGANPDVYFEGIIDEVKISYETSLIGYWNFNEGSGQVTYDTSGYENHGQLGSTSGEDASDPTWSTDTSPESGNLVLEHLYDEGTGNIAYDTSGYDNHGTIYGATWTDGINGKALSFDGNDYISVASSTSFDFVNEFSLEAWVKTAGSSSQMRIIDRDIGMGVATWTLFKTDDNRAGFAARGNNDQGLGVYSTSLLNDNNWHHIVGTFYNGEYKIYFDGNMENSGTAGAVDFALNSEVRIGTGTWYTSEYFNGLIDEVRIYNRALSAEEIQAHYNPGTDLTVSSSDITFSNPNPNPGDDITISATVHNIGNVDASPFNIKFYDHLASGDNIQIGSTKRVPGLAAGSSTTVYSDSWTVPGGTHSAYVVVDTDNEVVELSEDNNAAQKPVVASDSPVITSFESEYNGFYIKDFFADNKYTAEVYSPNPGDPVTRVKFVVAGTAGFQVFVDENPGDGFSFSYDMGNLSVGYNQISAVAYSQSGLESNNITIEEYIVTCPQWLKDIQEQLGIETKVLPDGTLEFSKEWKIPEKKIGGSFNVPEIIPVLGGEIKFKAGATAKVVIRTDGTAELSGGGGAELKLAEAGGGNIGVAITGYISFLDESGSFILKLDRADITIEGGLTIPVQKWPIQVFGVGVDVGINILPEVSMEFIFKSGMANQMVPGIDLGFDGGSGTVGIGVQAYLEVGIGIGNVEITITGTPSLTVGVPEPYLRQFAIELELEATLKGFWGGIIGSYSYTWGWSTDFNDGNSVGGGSSLYGGYQPLIRDWGQEDMLTRYPNDVEPKDTLSDDILEDNVYPLAHPSMAVDDNGNAMMLWAHDNISKPMPLGFDIYYSCKQNSSENWSEPLPVCMDDYPDFKPEAMFLKNGDALVVWQRFMNDTLNESINPFFILDQVELMYSIWNSSTGNWSSPAPLTNNSVYEDMYSLSISTGGDILLAYVEDPDNDIDTPYGRRIMSRIYNGTWSEEAIVVDDILIDTTPTSVSENELMVCWIEDTDNNTHSRTDREIFYSVNNGSWTAKKTLTNNSVDVQSLTAVDVGNSTITSWVESSLVKRSMDNETEYTSDGNESTFWGFHLKSSEPTNQIAIGVLYENSTWEMLTSNTDFTVINTTGYVNMTNYGSPPANATFHAWYEYEAFILNVTNELNYFSNGSESSYWGYYLRNGLVENETYIVAEYENGTMDVLVPYVDYTVDNYTGYVNMTGYGIPPANMSFYSWYSHISNSGTNSRLVYAEYSSGLWTNSTTITERPNILEPQLGKDSNGNIVAVWKGHSNENQTIWYSVYDNTTGIWSQSTVLDADERTTTGLSMCVAPDSRIFLGYIKGDVVESNGTLELFSEDLYATIYDINADLEVTADGISVSNINPIDGENVSINVTVINKGTIKTGSVWGLLMDETAGMPVGDLILIPPLNSNEEYILQYNWIAPGDNITHELKCYVDPYYTLVELDETNNNASVMIVLPDISIDEDTVRLVEGLDDDYIFFNMTNQGNADQSGTFDVHVYNGHPSDNGTLLDSLTIPSMAHNETNAYNVSLTPDAGGLDIYVFTNNSQVPNDYNLSNNLAVKHFSFYLDYNVTDLSVSNAYPIPQENVDVHVGLENLGQCGGNMTLRLYHGNPYVNGSYEIENQTTYIARNGSLNSNFVWQAEPGYHSLYMMFKPEFVESRPIVLYVANITVTDSPDMTFNNSYLEIDNPNPNDNETINITVNVKNTGYCDLYGSTVTMYRNNSGTFEKITTLLVDFLPMQSNRTMTFTINNLTYGAWNLTFTVDANDMFIESNESNNNLTYEFYVNQIPQLDLGGLIFNEDNGLVEIYLPNYTIDDGPIEQISYNLTYNSDPSNITVDIVNDTLRIEALPNWFGNVSINIEVSDEYVTKNYTYIIEISPVNDAPVITNYIDDFDIVVNGIDSTTVNLSNNFDDIDSILNFSYSGNQNISVIILANNSVTFTPATNWTGNETITFTASDEDYSVSDNVTVSVYDPYQPMHSFESPNNSTADLTPAISVQIIDESEIDQSSIKLYVQGFSVVYLLTPIPGGYNVSYTHESGFSDGDLITCRIVADDIFGNTLDYYWQFTVNTSSEFQITLHQGWNLISIPLIQSNTSIPAVLSSIDGEWDYIQYYNATDSLDHWKSYATFKPISLNDLSEVDHKMAIWVNIITPGGTVLKATGTKPTSTTLQLKTGWNFVGYPSLTSGKTVNEALGGIAWDQIEKYDSGSPYRITSMNGLEYMIPGQGYWIHVTSDCDWVVDW